MKLKEKFSEDDLLRIKTAVATAEEKISGEIVPVMVERSDGYVVGNYRAALVLGAAVFTFMIVLDRFIIHDASHALYYDPLFIFITVLLGGVIGATLPEIFPGVKRLFLSRKSMDVRCHDAAENAFLEEEIFNTRHRTGIMIFISFFEHEVIVVADRGISKIVEQKEWDLIVKDLLTQIRLGKVVDGLVAAISRCGQILLEKGFLKTADDINELRDDLRIN
jgi:putative membrane protein